MAKVIDQIEFNELVLNSKGVILIDFFATWCGPCKALAPVLEEVSVLLKDKVHIYKVDIDQSQALAKEYRVMSVPTMKIFKDGQVVETIVGLQSKNILVDKLNYYAG
ncbi:thioredoxin [Acetobacterium paludosum]|uniref:Thioredoxin n=1 Tax=Acetobacterium paludosum TaxID=52693 RepID=A0A923HTP1_9FIRM|nr:thioredoxin [Acetobacterium paludosum]MBC3888434.1 thioredoxin [Acetobacterium paludosum]